MENENLLQHLIVDPIKEMLTTIAGFIPTFLGALAILFVGWIIAKVISKLVLRLLNVVRFNTIAEKAGINEVLAKGGLRISTSEMISRLIYWLVMVVVLVMTVNAIGLTVASQLLERLTVYIPRVIAAIFVLVIGMFLANVISGVVGTTATNAKIPKPELLGSITRWAILVFSFIIALGELGIATLLVSTTFNIFFGALCLALALSFGLGGRDIAAKILQDFYNRYSS
jgi:hypothetical protein